MRLSRWKGEDVYILVDSVGEGELREGGSEGCRKRS